MTEPNADLAQALAALKQALVELEAGDSSARLRIEPLLQRLNIPTEPPQTLHEAVAETLRSFEVEHPQLTTALERVMLALSSMGI